MQRFTAVTLLAISALCGAGCGAGPLTADKVSGLYQYDSGDRGTETVCFVLSPDGTYALGNADAPAEEISFSGTPSKGDWELTDQKIRIGNASYPIKRISSGIRIVLDSDQDMYCDSERSK
jgi:hypothetical protein